MQSWCNISFFDVIIQKTFMHKQMWNMWYSLRNIALHTITWVDEINLGMLPYNWFHWPCISCFFLGLRKACMEVVLCMIDFLKLPVIPDRQSCKHKTTKKYSHMNNRTSFYTFKFWMQSLLWTIHYIRNYESVKIKYFKSQQHMRQQIFHYQYG